MRASSLSAEVAVIRWPADADARTLLAREGRLRLLVVADGVAAPTPVDELEDWVHDPVNPVEVLARCDALRERAAARARRPRIDEWGLLHFDGRWVAVSDGQLPIVHLLVERFGQLVPHDELFAAYTGAGGTRNTSSIRTALTRVRHRITDVGLTLHSARQKGVVLDVADDMER